MKIGFIGAGNMASAIIKGIMESGFADAGEIYVSDPDGGKLARLAQDGIRCCNANTEAAQAAELIVLAVKPNVLKAVAESIKDVDGLTDKLVVSIAAGVPSESISQWMGGRARVVRLMPNTPAMVGKGMTAVCKSPQVTEEELAAVERMCATFGKVVVVEEKLMDAVTAVSGSGPAYIYMMIEAMADGGVLCGLPRQTAVTLTAQTVLGAAEMVLESGQHPGELKDMVCSPGGTTIEAVYALEQAGMRGAVIEAVKKCAEKSARLK